MTGTAAASVGAAVLLLGLAAGMARADDQPGFDCRAARTAVEHVLCSGGENTLPWLDRTLALLYRQARAAPGADAAAMTAAQRRWLRTRDECRGDADAIRACLEPLYWQRITVLAAAADPAHLTGLYRAPDINGTLRAATLPDGTVALDAQSDTGPPRDASCLMSATLAPVGGRLVCAGEACTGVAGCVITVTPSPGRFTISSSRCDGVCGMGASIDGLYTRR